MIEQGSIRSWRPNFNGVTLESNRETIPIHDYNEWLKSKERSFSEN